MRPRDESLVLVEVNRLDASLNMLKGRVGVLGLKLKLLDGMPPDEPLALRGELIPGPVTLDPTQALTQALAGRPETPRAKPTKLS